MTETKKSGDGAGAAGAAEAGVGDVEAAGETTAAAATADDNADAKPVGADTMVKVEGTPHPSDGKDD